MKILYSEYSDKENIREVYNLLKTYDSRINKHMERVLIVEKELAEGYMKSRLKELKLATRLIAKDMDRKSFPLSGTVEHNIERIYKAGFNTEEQQLKQAVVELKRCADLIKDYHHRYSQSWGSVSYGKKCKNQGMKNNPILEKALDIKQEVRLKRIEFRLVKERQALIEEKAFLLKISKKISELVGKDVESGLLEVIADLNIEDKALHKSKSIEEKQILKRVYKYLYETLEFVKIKEEEVDETNNKSIFSNSNITGMPNPLGIIL